MTKTFTQEDLIRYMYRETSEEETRQLDRQLTNDSALRTQFRELREMMMCLDQALLTPSATAMSGIRDDFRLSRI